MRDRDLRSSLQAIGLLQPGQEYSGRLIDGRRREPLCRDLGIPFEIHSCNTLREACSILWAANHEQRALELAHSEGAAGVLELAALCGTTPTSVAKFLQQTQPKKSHKRQIKDATNEARSSNRMLRRLVTLEPELYALAKACAAEIGHKSFPRLVRDALWKEIRDNVPGAPLQPPRRVQPANGARRRTG